MTYLRAMRRNGLADGDYQNDGTGQASRWNTQAVDQLIEQGDHEGAARLAGDFAREVERLYGARRMLMGDLRRLERDTTDESWICRNISERTGVAVDDVAAVLAEWMKV